MLAQLRFDLGQALGEGRPAHSEHAGPPTYVAVPVGQLMAEELRVAVVLELFWKLVAGDERRSHKA